MATAEEVSCSCEHCSNEVWVAAKYGDNYYVKNEQQCRRNEYEQQVWKVRYSSSAPVLCCVERALQAERDRAVQDVRRRLFAGLRDLPAGVVTEALVRRVTRVRSVEQEHVDGVVGLVSQLRQYCESERVQGHVALLACAGTFAEDVQLRCFQWKWRPDKAEPCGGHGYVLVLGV